MAFEIMWRRLRQIHMLAILDYKSRNEGSILGIFWHLLNPLFLFIVLFIVFSQITGPTIAYYPFYLIIGIMLFNLFRQITTEAANIVEHNQYFIKSTCFPKTSLIIGIVYRYLLSHLVEIILICAGLALFGFTITAVLFYVPVLFFFLLFITGISFTLAILNIYFVDMHNIWQFVLLLLWFATPIFYSVKQFPLLEALSIFNPLYYFLEITRNIILYNTASPLQLYLGVIVFSLASFVIGIAIYMHFEKEIPELI